MTCLSPHRGQLTIHIMQNNDKTVISFAYRQMTCQSGHADDSPVQDMFALLLYLNKVWNKPAVGDGSV